MASVKTLGNPEGLRQRKVEDAERVGLADREMDGQGGGVKREHPASRLDCYDPIEPHRWPAQCNHPGAGSIQ